MLLYQIIEHKRFCLDESIAFDFSNEFPITFVEFLNFSDGRDLKHMVTSRSKYLGANTVLIAGGNSTKKNDFKFNLDGIKNLIEWNDPFYIGTFVEQLLIKNNSKYNIFYGDCAGSYTALIASKNAPVNSLFLSSPTINASDLADQPIDSYTIPGIHHRKEVIRSINLDPQVLDAFPILLKNIQQGVKVSIHWSKHITGVDLYEKNRVLKIPKCSNLEIVEHSIPYNIDPHHLAEWLSKTHQLRDILEKEIQFARAVLNL